MNLPVQLWISQLLSLQHAEELIIEWGDIKPNDIFQAIIHLLKVHVAGFNTSD